MKIVIIGGGLAGVASAIFLHRHGHQVTICERENIRPIYGNAFMVHLRAMNILKELRGSAQIPLPGKPIEQFVSKNLDDSVEYQMNMRTWTCMRRSDMIGFLYDLLPEGILQAGLNFSHFERNDEGFTAAIFENGQRVDGDIFIGADGANSKVREALFGDIQFSKIEVKEMVGISRGKNLVEQIGTSFTKYKSQKEGRSMGFIPVSEEEIVWFIQYDCTLFETEENFNEIKSIDFCYQLIHDFPPICKKIIDHHLPESLYNWRSRDFDLLDELAIDNAVLIGDAAHLALPFTSAGTTNAMVDAKVLVEQLLVFGDFKLAFKQFYRARKRSLQDHLNTGRELKKRFLQPEKFVNAQQMVPLITDLADVSHLGSLNTKNERLATNPSLAPITNTKSLNIIYFTDPICSSCWGIEPQLRKLKSEYGQYFHLEYRMGGLLPSWEQYGGRKITSPHDAAQHWDEVSHFYDMPLDGDIWLEDPLGSSYPPSVAFKAAQLQDTEKARQFLRRLREMVFLEKKNITQWEKIEQAAIDSGLDIDRILEDQHGDAIRYFEDDLLYGKELEIKGFPTFFFVLNGEVKSSLYGYQTYEQMEAAVLSCIPNAQKTPINHLEPTELFELFHSLTKRELMEFAECSEEIACTTLDRLTNSLKIEKFSCKNGDLWRIVEEEKDNTPASELQN